MRKNIRNIKKGKEKIHSNTTYCNDIELIIDYIYSNTDFSKAQIRDIVDAQFRMLKDTVMSGGLIDTDSNFEDFSIIRLIRLGLFSPSKKKFEYMKEAFNKNEEKE